MKKHYRHENDCLNCGTVLEGKFCHHCGQENLQIKENFGHLMNHAISDYFHFDHQFFHTLKPLLFQPGKLTNEYMLGKRVQYLHPIKMYIFISLIFFILIFKHNNEVEKKHKENGKISPKEAVALKKRLDANPALTPSQRRHIEAIAFNAPNVVVDSNALDSLGKGGVKVKKTMSTSATGKTDTLYHIGHSATTVKAKKHKADDDDDNRSSFYPLFRETDDSTYTAYTIAQQKLSADERDGFFTRLYEKKKFAYKAYGDRAQEVFLEELKHNVPKMMFVLLPLFALILRFAFWKNKKFYVEHLIFSFHLHCFVFLFLIIAMLLKLLPDVHNLYNWIGFIVTLGIIIYIYKALRAVYHRSRFRTVSKMIGVSFVYLFAFSFCMMILVLVTAVTAV